MHAGRGQRNNGVARAHFRVVDDTRFFHNTYGKTRKVVLIFRVKAGHLGRLAAHQGRTSLHAALGHASHDGGYFFRHILSAGNVIQKHQRLCPAGDDVVHAHGNAVDAHGVVLVHQEGQFQLGAHTVRAGHQHRV